MEIKPFNSGFIGPRNITDEERVLNIFKHYYPFLGAVIKELEKGFDDQKSLEKAKFIKMELHLFLKKWMRRYDF